MADQSFQQFGNDRLLQLLGRGGQVSVYLGQPVHLELAQAAIKVLHAPLSQEAIKAFWQEAGTIAALEHPHRVRLLDFDVREGIPFLIMDDYLDGPLRQKHRKGERVPLLTVASVKQLAEVLPSTHDQKRVHRDVKPENMLIDRGDEGIVSDCGLAIEAHGTSLLSTRRVTMRGRRGAGTITLDFPIRTTLQHWLQRRKTPVGVARRAHTMLLRSPFSS